MRFVLFLPLLILTVFQSCALCQSFECEGTVRSSVKIQFSKLQIQLLNQDKIVKTSVEVAPNNGYYLIPFEGRDKYYLKVSSPEGWSFDPEYVLIDGKDGKNPCPSDIDFTFSGFTVSGQVIEKESTTGPSDVNVSIFEGSNTRSTKTQAGGKFSFYKVMPGLHKIVVDHPRTTFQQSETSFEVSDQSLILPPQLVISGYEVVGKIENEGEGVPGVLITLSGKKGQSDCKPSIPTDYHGESKDHVCATQSDQKGFFKFTNVPFGEYVVRPKLKSGNSDLAIIPESLTFVVQGFHEFVNPFVVSGFGLTGRVVHSISKKGVSGADVFINGEKKATTDENGFYRLDHITSGEKTITAKKEGIHFTEVKAKVSPSQTSVDLIEANSYSVCGKVVSESGSKNREIKSVNKSTNKSQQVATNSDSQFCFFLTPGSYDISPIISQKEIDSGLVLSPPSIRVQVEDSIISGIIFGQTKSKVSGQVNLLSNKCDSKVTLSSKSRGFTQTTDLSVSGAGSCSYSFSNVLPGVYQVNIENEELCWENPEIKVEVSSEETLAETFHQKGYKIYVNSPEDLTISIQSEEDSETEQWTLKKGKNSLCIEDLTPLNILPHECFRFSDQKIETKNRNIEIVISHFKVQGSIQINKLPNNPVIKIESNGKEIQTNVVESEQGYNFSFWAQKNSQYKIQPDPIENVQFQPSSRLFTTELPKCQSVLEKFTSKYGEFIEGETIPPIEDALVVAVHQSGHQTKTTTVNGKFKIGPLFDPDYEITVEKEGYTFTKHSTKKYAYEAKKLSQILVQVKDSNGLPISGVLIAISGANREKGNTKESGKVSFSQVPIGNYYVKPLLKEYAFEPSSQTIIVEEEKTTTVDFIATRVAFSCSGKVVSLNGQPEGGLTIEAIGKSTSTQQLHSEEVDTNEKGLYTLKGLQPGYTYNVKIKKGESNPSVWKVIPSSGFDFEMKKEDVDKIDFLVISRKDSFEIAGVVNAPLEHLSNIKVELSSSQKTIKSIQAGPTRFFEFSDLAKNTSYTIKLRTTLDANKFVFESEEVQIPASDKLSTFVEVGCKINEKIMPVYVAESSFFSLLLVIVVAAIGLNKNKVLKFYQSFQEDDTYLPPEANIYLSPSERKEYKKKK